MEMDLEAEKQCNRYVGSCCGNSFIIFDCREFNLEKEDKANLAIRDIIKYGVDSALFLRRSSLGVAMEVFEKDGTESESCGNGALLFVYMLGLYCRKIEMKDNAAMIDGDYEKISILMSLKFSYVKRIAREGCYYVKFGEPHLVYIVENIEEFDLLKKGREIQDYYPWGINVDVVQKVDESIYLIKTYERGVFAQTKSCGTGSLCSYLAISQLENGNDFFKRRIEFKSTGGSHWVYKEADYLKLETLKRFCKIKKIF